MTASIIPFDAGQASQLAYAMKQLIVQMMNDKVLIEGVHYGTIPGTNKPTLYKPGAEYLISAHKLNNVFVPLTVIEDWERGFFFYRYECRLTHRETGELYGTGAGSCNSMEAKYRWRWVGEDQLPEGIDLSQFERKDGRRTLSEFEFAIDKAETSGQYGKPAEHWQMFKDAIANGTAKRVMKPTKRGDSVAYEITVGATSYRIPNTEPYDLVNTIDKMAQKRALIASALIATNASEFFTQDLEDFIQSPVITIADDTQPVTSDDDLHLSVKTASNAPQNGANQRNDRQSPSSTQNATAQSSGANSGNLKSTRVTQIKVVAVNDKNWIVADGDIWIPSRQMFRDIKLFECEEWTQPGDIYNLPYPVLIWWEAVKGDNGKKYRSGKHAETIKQAAE